MKYKKYTSYKDSGVEWLGEVPSGWLVLQLRRISTLQQGLQIAQDKRYYESGDNRHKYITIKAINSGINSQNNEYILNAPKSVICHNDDILLARTGATGEVITDIHGVFHNNFFKVDYCRSKILKYYLVYLLKNKEIKDHLLMLAGTTTIPDLNHGAFLGTKITLPIFQEQRQIVDFLDSATSKIDTLIEKQEKLIELLKEKRQAVISHAVTKGLDPEVKMKDSGVDWLGKVPVHWTVLKIKYLSRVSRGASPRPIDDPKYFDDEGEYAWVRIADVSKSNMYLSTTIQKLSILGSSLSVKLDRNKLFVSIAGTVGKPCITNIKVCIHDGFVYFPDLEEIYIMYLYRVFEAGECYGGLGKMGTQLNLNTETIGGIDIVVPPKHELIELISYLENKISKIDKLVDKANKSIELLKEKRTALISSAVTGKIDIRE